MSQEIDYLYFWKTDLKAPFKTSDSKSLEDNIQPLRASVCLDQRAQKHSLSNETQSQKLLFSFRWMRWSRTAASKTYTVASYAVQPVRTVQPKYSSQRNTDKQSAGILTTVQNSETKSQRAKKIARASGMPEPRNNRTTKMKNRTTKMKNRTAWLVLFRTSAELLCKVNGEAVPLPPCKR
jgi:hypothetical protein